MKALTMGRGVVEMEMRLFDALLFNAQLSPANKQNSMRRLSKTREYLPRDCLGDWTGRTIAL